MEIKYGKIELPHSIKLEKESATDKFGRFIAEPLEKGYGHTVGNSLRRVLLSSIESPAVIGIRIDGFSHEYMAQEGIVEDMVNIILNIKNARFSRLPLVTEEQEEEEEEEQEEEEELEELEEEEEEEFEIVSSTRKTRVIPCFLKVTEKDLAENNGTYKVKLGDVVKDTYFTVVNPDLYLFSVTKPMERSISFRIGYGRGYVAAESHKVLDKVVDEVIIDSIFSPITLANYFVEKTRVGQATDFDKLILEVKTDGRISPKEAVSFASQILAKHYEVFKTIEALKLVYEDAGEVEKEEEVDELMEKLSQRIDEIELSVRSTNCINKANISTIGELVTIPERRMLEFRNFGKKSLREIKDKLTEMGLSLGMDLTRLGISQENIKDKIAKYLEEKSKKQMKEKEEGGEGYAS